MKSAYTMEIKYPKYTLYFDGGSRGNPGRAGAGAVIYLQISACESTVEVWSRAVFVGHSETCNVAEYMGLITGLEYAKKAGIKVLWVKGDSQLVIKQMTGEYRVSATHLVPLHAHARALCGSLEAVDFEHVYRKNNKRADELSNVGMDAGPSAAAEGPLRGQGYAPRGDAVLCTAGATAPIIPTENSIEFQLNETNINQTNPYADAHLYGKPFKSKRK